MSEENQEPRKQTRDELARGVDSEGFFTVRIHVDHGLEKIIGVLMTSVDMIKAFYIEQHQRAQKNGLVKPNSILERFKNKWQ